MRWRSGPVERLIEEIAAVCTRDTGPRGRRVWGSERRAEDNMVDDRGKLADAICSRGRRPRPRVVVRVGYRERDCPVARATLPQISPLPHTVPASTVVIIVPDALGRRSGIPFRHPLHSRTVFCLPAPPDSSS